MATNNNLGDLLTSVANSIRTKKEYFTTTSQTTSTPSDYGPTNNTWSVNFITLTGTTVTITGRLVTNYGTITSNTVTSISPQTITLTV